MKRILDYILNNKNLTMFIAGIVVALLFLNQCNRIENLKNDVKIAQQIADRNLNNFLAAQDTIQTERNINGNLISSISSYEYTLDQLVEDNEELLELYNKELAINDEYKKINNLISAQLEIKDSIISASKVTMDNDSIKVDLIDNKEWDKYNWRNFRGQVVLYPKDSLYFVKRSVFDIQQGISLKMAILDINGRSQLKITSPYPNLTFTNIENINIVNDRLNRPSIKKGGWSIGLGVSYGINLNNQQVISYGPSIGIGLYYSPKWLRF
jgi:hypothetical protein